MRRISIVGFRNFASTEFLVGEHVVIVGENGSGKSNLVHALRLLLDPSLPDSQRHLRDEDFWDGISRPLAVGAEIRISVELSDFEDNDAQLASLAEYLVEPEPMIARLTYVCRRTDSSVPEQRFDCFVFGGHSEDVRLGYDVRRRLPLEFVHALRDVESDLQSWRRSPLRPLLERAWSSVDDSTKLAIKRDIESAAASIGKVPGVAELQTGLAGALTKLAGEARVAAPTLGVAPTDVERFVRTVRMLFDGGARTIADASLGVANILYLTLKILELLQLVKDGERDHTFLAVEEPEAHLHPQLQRQVFRTFLRLRPHLPAQTSPPPLLVESPTSIVLTTHSPHLASVARLQHLVVLQSEPAMSRFPEKTTVHRTRVASTAGLDLDESTIEDIERYLDVSRAELLFARGVLLVEGEAEMYLVPAIAHHLGKSFDSLGLCLCPVWGTHFASYVRLLRELGIPFVVLTDGDPTRSVTGAARADRLLLDCFGVDPAVVNDALARERVLTEFGVFVGGMTLEVDLIRSGWTTAMATVLRDNTDNGAARNRAKEWLSNGNVASNDEERFVKDVKEIGKGRYSQRLASLVTADLAKNAPAAVLAAINDLVSRCM